MERGREAGCKEVEVGRKGLRGGKERREIKGKREVQIMHIYSYIT